MNYKNTLEKPKCTLDSSCKVVGHVMILPTDRDTWGGEPIYELQHVWITPKKETM